MTTKTKIADGWYAVHEIGGYTAYEIKDGRIVDSISSAEESSHRAGGAYIEIHNAVAWTDPTECLEPPELETFCRLADITDEPDPEVGVVPLSFERPNAPDGWYVLFPGCEDTNYEIIQIVDREVVQKQTSSCNRPWPTLHDKVREMVDDPDWIMLNCTVGYKAHEAIVSLWSPGSDPEDVAVHPLSD